MQDNNNLLIANKYFENVRVQIFGNNGYIKVVFVKNFRGDYIW
jgi:hypothetical protein